MERYIRLLQVILISWFTFAWYVDTSFANLVVPFEMLLSFDHPYAFYYLMIGCLVATVIVEYPVVYLLLGRPAKARIQLFLWLLFVNVITNPAVQIALLFLDPAVYLTDALFKFGLIELAVVMVEFGLLHWIFSRMHRCGALVEPIKARCTFVIGVLANLASFVLGGIGTRAIASAAYGVPYLGIHW
jgi:hypothetical protein